ncbi:COG3152 Predicted membrane protein [Flavobacteriaceae bacterium]|jgi:uncharacterized membrane protein YhaH (DUF805 family)
MIEWYKKVVFENYANFSGRARRKEYWMFALATTLISIPLNYILPLAVSPKLALLGTFYGFAVLIPSFAVGVRRMHDIGKSGWYIIIPIYNLILACTEGDQGTNEYGPDPKNDFEEINEIGTTEV